MHFLFLSLFVLVHSSYVHDVPLFVWSGESFVVSRNSQVRGFKPDVTEVFDAIVNKDAKVESLAGLVNPSSPLELAVFFLDPSLSSEEMARDFALLPTLAEKMTTLNSFYYPYAVLPGGALSTVAETVKTAKSQGAAVYYFGSDFLKGSAGTVQRISSFADIVPSFTNGKTDILIVHIDEDTSLKRLEAIESAMRVIQATFEKAQFTRYVSVLSGVRSDIETVLPVETTEEREKRAILADAHNYGNGTPPRITHGYNTFNTYFSGVFWELFTILIVFWSIIIFGTKQLLQLQAPDRIPLAAGQSKKKKVQ